MTCEDQETVTLPEMCPQSVSLFDDGPLLCRGSSQSGTRAVVNPPHKAKGCRPAPAVSLWVRRQIRLITA